MAVVISDIGEEKAPVGSSETNPSPSFIPYTTFRLSTRRTLVFLLGYLSLASSLTANIYFPLIEVLSHNYNVSVQKINLTITLFYVFQGIAPSFWSPLSDTFGRRPVYMSIFIVYTVGSLGLSVSGKSYASLLIFRALQSVGGSAVLSLSYAVVSDFCVHSERGSFIAPMMTAANIGPLIGPVIGGGIALATGHPVWCFRALLIFGGSGVLLIGWLMPETGRMVVGNGSVPAQGIWRSWWSLLRERRRLKNSRTASSDDEKGSIDTPRANASLDGDINTGKDGRGKWVMPNPFPSIRLIGHPDTFLILWLAASPYAFWSAVQTTMTPIFSVRYGFNSLEVGAAFLAGGVGILAGGFVAGKLMDVNYSHEARKVGITTERERGEDIAEFPIERARSRGSTLIIAISIGAVVGYGWAIQKHAHPAILLVLQLYLGCRSTALHQTYSALIVDIFPETPGTAAAANNITRCTLSAVVVAALSPLIQAIGYGWIYTLLGLLDGVGCIIAIWMLRRWGKKWRERRNTARV
ncbi:major facilitator superfamily transporter [Xylariaceae sp. FL0255]|nr:major facilitator superfamily transporter [Xylariaceae sp. FL0255]